MTIEVTIDQKSIGSKAPLYLIAEVGTTHLGQLDKALALVEEAAASGMDAVKFQLIDPFQDSDRSVEYSYQSSGQKFTTNMSEMFETLGMSAYDWQKIAAHAKANEISFFATVDYFEAIDLCLELETPAMKLGAWDTTYIPLIKKVAQTGLPTFVDLGPTTSEEFDTYVATHEAAGGGPLLFLHDYHTSDPLEFNLRAIEALTSRCKWPVGYSSPGLDDDIDFVALGLGARFIEKRLILSRNDHAFHAEQSLEPSELRDWAYRIRRADSALGQEAIIPSAIDVADSRKYYRSICSLKPISAGDLITVDNVAGKRPGTGLPTSMLSDFWGRKASHDLPADKLLNLDDVE